MEELTLECPIRGRIKARAKSADGLSPSEERLRIDAIRYLIRQGYPKENIKVEAVLKRFGNSGRNSFRADLAALDVPVGEIPQGDVEALLRHSVLLGEVKRDNRGAEQAKNTQVRPMLDFATREDCVGLYWDDVEQRVFWQERIDGVRETREGSLALLPPYGNRVNVKPLTFADITATDSLLATFERIEDILHAASVDPERRYGVMLQLLLAKLFDEHAHESQPDVPLDIQDPVALGTSAATTLERFNQVLGQAATYYGRHLPKPVAKTLGVDADTLVPILQVLAPIRIISSSNSVVQSFYMHFAKHLYRWDLAQYFTPTTVTSFIIDVLSPQFGEHIKDPACGSADFLTAAFKVGREFDPNYADCVWGADNSTNAVQVAVLNMLLNGDGKSNLVEEDSLLKVDNYLDHYEIMVCNPPFGSKIVESRSSVLRKFDLGYEWAADKDGVFQKTKRLKPNQETGLLFAEVCVKQVRPGGRIGIIFPNGYLGNRSAKFAAFREWLLRSCKVASICSFPRFTFKTSGADVSASVVFLEKREKPLSRASEDDTYDFNIEMIECVGWNVGNKRAEPVFQRDPEDGTFLTDTEGDRILEEDFGTALADMRASVAADEFPWLASRKTPSSEGWSVSISEVLADDTLCLDPKRLCRKNRELRLALAENPHILLGDLVDFIPERTDTAGKKVRLDDSTEYRYVEIQDVSSGAFGWTSLRGWALPSRARHHAERNDIYIGAIWGSVGKWFVAGADAEDIVATNGFHRLRLKPGKEDLLPDLIASLCTEAYSTQMRAFARGSDGLAEVWQQDAMQVLIPLLSDEARAELTPLVERLNEGRPTVDAAVSQLVADGTIGIPIPNKRPSHSVLV